LLKIVVIGDSGVGKTNLVSMFVDGVFVEDEKPTVGVEFSAKSFSINGKDIRCQIWDTAGQERFRAVTKAYYNGAVGAIVVFDLANLRSFESVSKWIEEASENTKKETVILLVGNKADLKDREVKLSRIEDLLASNSSRVVYIETSAFTGQNVEEAFRVLVEAICDRKRSEMEAIKKSLLKSSQQESQVGSPMAEKDAPIKLKAEIFDGIGEGKGPSRKKRCC
jgi:small GTP-binding protein